MRRALRWGLVFLALAGRIPSGFALTVSIDFSRDTVGGTNPGGNPAPVLFAGAGPAPAAGTFWNDGKIPLAATGDQGADTILHPVLFSDLTASDGITATAIDIELTSGFYRAFNSAATPAGDVTALQNDRVFPRLGQSATLTIKGLVPTNTYDLYFIGSGNFSTAFTIGSTTNTASGNAYDGSWTDGGEYVFFLGIAPSGSGEIAVGIQDGAAPIDSFGVISGLQIVGAASPPPVRFLYADGATTTGGQFNSTYPPGNLLSNGFTGPEDEIDTTVDYIASGNNYATASGTTAGFALTFEFAAPAELDGLHVWNYVYRNGTGGANSPLSGVNAYTLRFYDGPAGTGSQIGSLFSGTLLQAQWDAVNRAQTVWFGVTYTGVRSVVMEIVSNHGGATFTGMNELAFNGTAGGVPASIVSFTTSDPFVQRPDTATLSWEISGTAASLEILPGVGDVLALTTGGVGQVEVSPVGQQQYTLVLNGAHQEQVGLLGLPEREKVHLYLLLGQSNMQGSGTPRDPVLDEPDPRVLQFGSRDGMESAWVLADHPLTSLNGGGTAIGMGLEFAKTVLTDRGDPDLVIGLINHALGATAIQWWAPGAVDTSHTNPQTGQPYHLYDEALQRAAAASAYGVVKGVLWHQGEYNANNNTNPASEPALYAGRLQALVDNLRTDLGLPGLPFVCGKFVPASWTNDLGETVVYTGLPNRAIVEAALADLPNQRANTYCVDNAGLRGRPDEMIHFDAWSQRELGRRYAGAMNNCYADPFLLYLGGFYSPAELLIPSITDRLGDNDGDGVLNYLEYAHLTDPTAAQGIRPLSPAWVSLAGEGDYPAIDLRRRFDTEAPEYLVEISDDLQTWRSNLDAPPTATVDDDPPLDNGDGSWTLRIRSAAPLEADHDSLFFRVRVTGP